MARVRYLIISFDMYQDKNVLGYGEVWILNSCKYYLIYNFQSFKTKKKYVWLVKGFFKYDSDYLAFKETTWR